jgi:hypothetical protein
MTAQELVIGLLEHSERLHTNWTKEQHCIWISALLADCVLEQNHKDNIVLTRLKSRIDLLYKTKK